MPKKNLLNIIIIILAALLIIIVNTVFTKRVEAIENDIHHQLPEPKQVIRNETIPDQ